jgi:hypothetical protein
VVPVMGFGRCGHSPCHRGNFRVAGMCRSWLRCAWAHSGDYGATLGAEGDYLCQGASPLCSLLARDRIMDS